MHVLVPCEVEDDNEVEDGNDGGDEDAVLDMVGVQDVELVFDVAHCDPDLLLQLVLRFFVVLIHAGPDVEEEEVRAEAVVRDMEEEDNHSTLVEEEDMVDMVHEGQVEGGMPCVDRDE